MLKLQQKQQFQELEEQQKMLNPEGAQNSPGTEQIAVEFSSPLRVVKDIYQNVRELQIAKGSVLLKTVVSDLLQAVSSKTAVRGPTGLIYDESMVSHCCLWDSEHPERPERLSRVLDRSVK